MTSEPKEILFENEAREKLCRGIDKLAEVIKVTLGPKGRNIGLQGWSNPKITNDGNMIVSDIELKDAFENMGVTYCKEAATKIKEDCGDGSSTTILLLQTIIKEGIKNITAGTNPTAIKRGMDKALKELLNEIDKISIPIGEKQIENIATIAASGDETIGHYIAQAFKKVGKDGVININEGNNIDTTIEMVEGLSFDRGYLSSYFCTNMENLTVEFTDPYILITDKKISSIQDILPILQNISATHKELLIIAEDIEGDALSTLVINKLQQVLKVAAIKAPSFGEQRKAILEDLAILTGATFISKDSGQNLQEAQNDILGIANKIIITKDKTTIISNNDNQQAINERIKQIEMQISNAKDNYDKEKLEERKSKLVGGVAMINIGASTEPEMKQKKQAFEDSLHSTRAAISEGIVPGGGIALLRSSQKIKDLSLSKDEQIGAQILFHSCISPCSQIITNSGQESSIIVEEILQKENAFGYNVKSEKIEDLLLSGVIDATKVVKKSIIYAVSIAGIILLTEAIVTPSEKK